MAMARKCYVFAFFTIWSLLCVSSFEEGGNAAKMTFEEGENAAKMTFEEGGNAAKMEKVKVVGEEQILRLPSEEESSTQAIPWEQSPIEIHSLRFPRRPIMGEEKEDLPNFQPGRLRPVRFRFGRPGGCHGKFKPFLMPREDPSQLQFMRRMGMGHHRHAHARAHAHPYLFPAMEDMRDDEKTSFRPFHAHANPERDGMGFEMQRERGFEGGFAEMEEEHEREAPWTAWMRRIFH